MKVQRLDGRLRAYDDADGQRGNRGGGSDTVKAFVHNRG